MSDATATTEQTAFDAKLKEAFDNGTASTATDPLANKPQPEVNPLAGKTLEDLLHPDVWVDGFTIAEIAKLTGRQPEEFESEVRALVNRGVLRVTLPSGALTRNAALPRPDMFNIPTRSGGFKGLV